MNEYLFNLFGKYGTIKVRISAHNGNEALRLAKELYPFTELTRVVTI
ncbi:MAG: hypothetical protein ACKOXB_11590 [Flavobacteriales bacterium]